MVNFIFPAALVAAATAHTIRIDNWKWNSGDVLDTTNLIPKLLPVDPEDAGVGAALYDAIRPHLASQQRLGFTSAFKSPYYVGAPGFPSASDPGHLIWHEFLWAVGLLPDKFTGFFYIFEGDVHDCIEHSSEDHQGSESCSFHLALDFCHAHGGELYMPDDGGMSLLQSMCDTDAAGAGDLDDQIFNPYQGTLSQTQFWGNLETVGVSGSDVWQTYAQQHMFGKFNENNMYSGVIEGSTIPFGSGTSNLVTESVNVLNDELFLSTGTSARQSYATTGGLTLDNNAYTNFPWGMTAVDNSLNAEDWNMAYMKNFFSENLSEQRCLSYECNQNPGGVGVVGVDSTLDTKLVLCTQNNIRPLCLMHVPVAYTAPMCPATFTDSATGASFTHCGDNVAQMSQLNAYDGGTATHSLGSGNTVAMAGSDAVVKARVENLEAKYLDACTGAGFANTAAGLADCKIAHPELDAHNNDLLPYKVGTVAGDCGCTCPALPGWNTANMESVTSSGSTGSACCAAGYVFSATDAYSYSLDADSRCAAISCNDEFDSSLTSHWWTAGATLNSRKMWFDSRRNLFGGAVSFGAGDHGDNVIHGVCSCPTAVCPAFDTPSSNGAWTVSGGTAVGATATHVCGAGFIGVNVVRTCSADVGTCTASWSAGTPNCVEIPTCPIPVDVEHGRHFNPGTGAAFVAGSTLDVGEVAEFICDAGYSPYFSGTNTPADHNSCWRHCFRVPTAGGHGWVEDAQLDELFCDCRPSLCPVLTVPATVQVVGGAAPGSHYNHASHNNWAQVQCADGYFNTETGTDTMQLLTECNWNAVGCERVGCCNPRLATCNFEEKVNFEHSCLSLDRVRSGDNTRTTDLANWATDHTTTASWNTFECDDGHLVVADALTDVLPGDTFSFTCRPGFKPYLKFSYAMAASASGQDNAWSSRPGSSCDAVCGADGHWASNCECRCSSACEDGCNSH